MTRLSMTSVAIMCAIILVSSAVPARGQQSGIQGPPRIQSDVSSQVPSVGTDAAAFVSEMAIAGMAEVQLGKMAAERAASADVKSFGATMVKDHTAANNDLKRVAGQMNIPLPAQLDKKHQALVDRLSELRGAAFDREYMDAMVTGHQEVENKLEVRAAGQSQSKGETIGTSGAGKGDSTLSGWAAKTLPTVQQHLAHAKSLQQKTN